MFIWLFVLAFIAFRVVRSSMNYEFGSSRKRTIIRMLVGTATFAAVFIHYALVGALLVSIWTGPTGEDPGAAFVITLVAISTGTAMWGFLIPKIVFSFVGTKPVDTDRSDDAQHNTHDNTLQRESEHVQQPVFMRQQPQTNETPLIPPGTPSPISRPTADEWLVVAPIAEQTDESQPKRPAKPILFGAGVLTLLAFATIAAVWIFNQTGDSHNLAKCDTLLRTQLASSQQLAENAGNANALIAAIQDQRAADCPRDSWNPVVTNITRNHEGNIDVTFSTLPGQTRGMAVTMPAEGTQRWVYLATKGQWYSSTVGTPQISAAPPESSTLPPPTYTPRPATTARLVPTHTTAPTHPTATSPPVPTPTLVSVKHIYVAAFGSCGGRYHGEQRSRRQQAATSTLKAGLQYLDDLRAIIEQNCAGAIEVTAAKLGATPAPTATPSMALALQRNPTPTSTPSPVSTYRPTPTHYKPTPKSPTAAINTYKPRTGEITTSLGQRVSVNVSGFNDSQMRFDQLVQIINDTERLLGIPYPAPAVTMLQVSNLNTGFCGNNQMSYATRYVDDPYVVENSAIKMRVDAECNKTFATIAHEVAHTWFHGNDPNNWIDEGLANAITYQLLATHPPDQAIYPPVTYCQSYRNISELESATPERENKDEHAGYSCNYSLGDGIMGALRQHHGDHGFNSRIAQLARRSEANSKRAYDITDIRKTLGDTSPALTIINRWYQGQPQMRRHRHLDAIQWVSPPTVTGDTIQMVGKAHRKIIKLTWQEKYCSQFHIYEYNNYKYHHIESVGMLLPENRQWTDTLTAEVTAGQVNPDGTFEATIQLHDNPMNGLQNPILMVRTLSEHNRKTNECGESEVLSIVDIR